MDALNLFGNLASISGISLKNGMQLFGKKIKATAEPPNEQEELKPEIAFVVEVTRNVMPDVKKYIQKRSMNASIIHVTTPEDESQLDADMREDWHDFIREFSRIMEGVQQQISPRKTHIFISAPASLALGIGCTIGNVKRPHIYHYDNKTQSYKLVIIADNELR
ncbi:MAG TPA: hypothetical protein DCS93_42865 [Microscillaceae bacterium]|nr:hypothetical protein [Microscillaceae bacterium]